MVDKDGFEPKTRLSRCGLCGRLTRSELTLNGYDLCRRCERRLVALFPGDTGYEELRRRMKRLIFG
ncbi:MAG TPA: sigma factor G inhibitor Gin [Bacillota bacterium]